MEKPIVTDFHDLVIKNEIVVIFRQRSERSETAKPTQLRAKMNPIDIEIFRWLTFLHAWTFRKTLKKMLQSPKLVTWCNWQLKDRRIATTVLKARKRFNQPTAPPIINPGNGFFTSSLTGWLTNSDAEAHSAGWSSRECTWHCFEGRFLEKKNYYQI